jgi:hypothetical protein
MISGSEGKSGEIRCQRSPDKSTIQLDSSLSFLTLWKRRRNTRRFGDMILFGGGGEGLGIETCFV